MGLAEFGALIETTQMIPPLNRFADIGAWFADLVALTVGLAAALPFRRRTA